MSVCYSMFMEEAFDKGSAIDISSIAHDWEFVEKLIKFGFIIRTDDKYYLTEKGIGIGMIVRDCKVMAR